MVQRRHCLIASDVTCYLDPISQQKKKKTVYDQNPQSKNIVRFRSQTAW